MSQPIHHAVYHIRNNAYSSSGGLLELKDGYRCYDNAAWCNSDATDINHFKQLWLFVDTKQTDANGNSTFYLQCVQPGARLYANQSGNNDISWTWGGDKYQNANHQWSFQSLGDDKYIIQNVGSGVNLGVSESNGSWWVGCRTFESWESNNQTWTLSRRSRSSTEVGALIDQHPDINPQAFRRYLADAAYLTLPDAIRTQIWNASLLGSKFRWRSEVFDCDDFAFTMKAEVAKWGNDNLRSDDVALLMGILFGDSPNGAHAFNWYLGQDLNSLKFFEPQNATEDDKALGYKGYFGVY